MEIVKKLNLKIANKKQRMAEAGVEKVIDEYEKEIKEYDSFIIQRNIILTASTKKVLKDEIVPNIKRLQIGLTEMKNKIEDILKNIPEFSLKEKNRITKLIKAVYTIEDIAIEMDKDIDAICKNVNLESKVVQLLMPEILRIMRLFELNDLCIEQAHNISSYACALLILSEKQKEDNKCRYMDEMNRQICMSFIEMKFPLIRKNISSIEALFVQKYKNIPIIQIGI